MWVGATLNWVIRDTAVLHFVICNYWRKLVFGEPHHDRHTQPESCKRILVHSQSAPGSKHGQRGNNLSTSRTLPPVLLHPILPIPPSPTIPVFSRVEFA